MDTDVTPMDVDNDDADTWVYEDQDIDSSDDEVNDINWRYLFQETFNDIRENQLDDGARPLPCTTPVKIRIKNLGETPLTFPLSTALCSRVICDHGQPLSLSNKYDFCGTKIVNTAWEIDSPAFDLPLPFVAAVRESTFELLHLTTPHLKTEFDVNLSKLVIFGPCVHPKSYNLDKNFAIFHATILVFLPSICTGGNYRFVDDNDDESDLHRHAFNQNECDDSRPFILVVPSDCPHEIEPIEKGFKLLLVFHLTSKTNSINQFYSSLANDTITQSTPTERITLTQRLQRILSYWENHLEKMPNKLLLPLQHPVDYSSFFSFLFRDKYRTTLELVLSAMQSRSSFLIYSAVLQRDEPLALTQSSRFVIHTLKLLNTTEGLPLTFDAEHERTMLSNEFLGDLHMYNDIFEQSSAREKVLPNGKIVSRNDLKFHVLVLIPCRYQWDLFLDDPCNAYHHLSHMFTLPAHSFDLSCLNFFDCLLRDKHPSSVLFEQLIDFLIRLRDRFGLAPKILQLLSNLLDNTHLKEEFLTTLYLQFNRLVAAFSTWPLLSFELLEFFRQVINSSMPTKLQEIVRFLLQLSDRTLRALFINTLLRHIFKPRAFPRHILLATLCSILHLLIVDGSYSIDSLLVLAYQIIKRVRKTGNESEMIQKCFKIHLIPMLIQIYRQNQPSLSPAFVLIYEYCLNTINYHCSTLQSSSSNIISMNEAHLICPCRSCARLQTFLIDPKSSTILYDLSLSATPDHCLRHTLSKFPMLALEYKHDPCTGVEQTLLVSKSGYETEQKQLCFHLRRLLLQLHRI